MYYSKLLAFPSISASTQLPHLFPGEMPSEGLASLFEAVGVDFPAIEPMLPQISDSSPSHDSRLDRTISTDAHLLNVTVDGKPIDMSAQRNRWVYQACSSVLKDLSKVTAADLLDAKAQNHACNHPELYSSLMQRLCDIYSKQLKSPNVTGVWPVMQQIMGVTDSTFPSLSFSEIINKAVAAFKERFKENQFTEKSYKFMTSEIEKLKLEFDIHQMHFSPTLVGKVKFEYQGPRSLFIISSALVLNMLRLSANCNVKMPKGSVQEGEFLREGKEHYRQRSQIVPQVGVEFLDANLKALLRGLPDSMKSMNPLLVEYAFPTQSSLVTITVDPQQSRNDRVEGLQSYKNILMQRHMLMEEYKDPDIVRFILSVIREGSIKGRGSEVLTPKQQQWIYDLTILLFGTECQRNRRSFFYHAVAFDMVLKGKLSLHSLLNDPAISRPGQFDFKENMLHYELQSVITTKLGKKWTTQVVVMVLKEQEILIETNPDLGLVQFNNFLVPKGTSYDDVLGTCKFPKDIIGVLADIWAARNRVEQDCRESGAATTCLPMVQEHAVTQTYLSTRRMGVVPKEYQGGSDQRHAPRHPTALERKEMLFFQYFVDTQPTLTVSAKNPNHIIDSTTGDPITEEQLVGLIRAYLDQFYGLGLSPVHA